MTGRGERDDDTAPETGAAESSSSAGGAGTAGTAFPPSPRLLSLRADPLPLPPVLHDTDAVASLHLEWARLAGSAQGASPPGARGDVRAKIRARLDAAALADAAADRALIGDLVRAVDAISAHVDEITARVGHLELLVQELVDGVSEDLARVQAALGTLDDRARDEA